jgi:hypothetical protein
MTSEDVTPFADPFCVYGRGDTTAQNKGMKQTSVEHIGRSQLIPGVRSNK